MKRVIVVVVVVVGVVTTSYPKREPEPQQTTSYAATQTLHKHKARHRHRHPHLLFDFDLDLTGLLLPQACTRHTRRTPHAAAMWASNASRLALLTCPTRTRAACACTLSPSVSLHSSESWRRSRIVRVTATADLDSGAGAVEVEEPAKIDRKAADWKKAEKVMESGSIHRGRVDACNSGGLLVRFGSLQGFLPFSQMDSSRVPKDGKTTLSEIAKALVGELVSVKMIEVIEAERRLIFSEKLAVLEENLRLIEEGSTYDGKVNSVTDFGAFVDLILPDGTSPVSGLVHISELSWDPVRNPRDLLEEGQKVRVKVLQVDKERMRLALSIKQLEADPLLETLDTLMPMQTQDSLEPIEQDAELLGTSLPGLEQICEELMNEEGINGVTLGRTRLEKRVVSQDLELWLANAPAEDGKFNLLARAGKQVQEVQLNTNLDREGIKAAVQRVTGRVP